MTIEIQNVVALVTGANRGIGRTLVEVLARAGARHVYAASRDGQPVTAAPNVTPVRLDVTDDAQVAEAAARCTDVNVLVNNAGVLRGSSFLAASSVDAARAELEVNYLGSLRTARAFAPLLARNGGGALVNVLSILSRVSSPRLGSYSASKAAAFSMTQGLRGELASQGTLVVGVMPGFVDTDMARTVSAPKLSPEAVAEAVVAALRDGTEDVYPGDLATTIAHGLLRDPKAVERQVARS
jgi:NAD(P)-dependent dehydrogenase (short-subunit alcohol dehydrogenase family)